LPTFTEFMRSRLPETVRLPDVLADLFDWIDRNGWVARGVDDEPYGRLSPGLGWVHDGTSVSFHVEAEARRAQFSQLWLGAPGLHDVLVPFAQTGADGSQAAFWVDPTGAQRIVHLGSGSGSTLTCVLADDPVDFVRLLAIGYDEVCWLAEPEFASPPVREDGHSAVNEPLRSWLRLRGATVPRAARELVPFPAEMGDTDSADPFCAWLEQVSG
jgi:hypothetical protein